MVTIMGIFQQLDNVVRTQRGLVEAGFSSEDLSTLSSVPLAEDTVLTGGASTRLPWIAFFGGIIGIIIGLSLAAGTAWLYPLPTGGKPVISLPPIGIITYEVMMLGALVATFFGALFEMRLPQFKKKAFSPGVYDGKIALLVRCRSEEEAEKGERILSQAGAAEIERYPGDCL